MASVGDGLGSQVHCDPAPRPPAAQGAVGALLEGGGGTWGIGESTLLARGLGVLLDRRVFLPSPEWRMVLALMGQPTTCPAYAGLLKLSLHIAR